MGTLTVPPDLNEIAIVRSDHPMGYRVGELDEARVRFLELNDVTPEWVGVLNVPDDL